MASIEPIFRSIDVGENLQLTLDAPIAPEVMQLMQPVGPNRYQMRPGTFHRAESITVEVAEDQNVQQMDFTYDPGTSYQVLFEDYRKDLGDPVQDNPEAAAAERRSVWEDTVTRFELFAQGHGDKSRVGSTLQNRAPAAA
jgi:hypothetical protein